MPPAERGRAWVVPVAAAAGALWGAVMAGLAWRVADAEVVLLQAWVLGPAWVAGVVARRRSYGALAGLALVGAAAWTYELLPGWGFEARLRDEGVAPSLVGAVAEGFDARDVVLWSTLAIGAVAGWAGALWHSGVVEATAPEGPAATEPPAPRPPPLWADEEPPPEWLAAPERPEAAARAPGPAGGPIAEHAAAATARSPVTAADPPGTAATPTAGRLVAGAVLVAALSTDAALDVLFGIYGAGQGALALILAIAAAGGAALAFGRYAVAVVLAGIVLACSMAAVQDAEYPHHVDEAAVR